MEKTVTEAIAYRRSTRVYKEDNIEGLGVLVSAAAGKKCARCWKVDEKIDNSLEDPLCNRCLEIVK